MKKNGLNLKETELTLGLPGSDQPCENKLGSEPLNPHGVVNSTSTVGVKRTSTESINGGSEKWGLSGSSGSELVQPNKAHASSSRAQVVGWPPVRSFRRYRVAAPTRHTDESEGRSGSGFQYVKVSMDGAPYLRKVDLKTYCSYAELSRALENMFSCFTIEQCSSDGVPGREELSESRLTDLLHGSEYVLTHEDKDGDWMLVGDVPWEMFTDSCKKLRMMKGSEAIGLAPMAVKIKNKNRSQLGAGAPSPPTLPTWCSMNQSEE